MALDRNARNWLVRLGFITLTCLCLLLIQSPFALAQVDMGSVTGTVSDTSGAVIPGAKVTLLNTDVGLTMEGISDSGGRYTFSPSRLGITPLPSTASGFSKTTQEAVTVNVSQVLQVNIATQAWGSIGNGNGIHGAATPADRSVLCWTGDRLAAGQWPPAEWP